MGQVSSTITPMKTRTLRPLVALVALLSLLTWVFIPGSTAAIATKVKVVRVIDGDTLVVKLSGKDVTVRILGIDTPETVKPGSPVACGGAEASARTKKLLPTGSYVTLIDDSSQPAVDRYGRRLAHVVMSDKQRVADVLLREGLAVRYRAATTSYDATFRTLEATAKASLVGNWSRCAG